MPADESVYALSLDLPSVCGPDWGGSYMEVSADVVYYTIDVLRCVLAQWRPPEGLEPVVLGREAAAARGVHHEEHLAAVFAQRLVFLIDGVDFPVEQSGAGSHGVHAEKKKGEASKEAEHSA